MSIKAETVGAVHTQTHPHTSVLKNKTVLVFAQKIEKYFVDFKTYLLGKMRSFCAHFTSGYI